MNSRLRDIAGSALAKYTGDQRDRWDECGFRFDSWIEALREVPAGPLSEQDVVSWIEGPLRVVFRFERFLGAYGRMSGGRIQRFLLLSSGHTNEFLSEREPSFDPKERTCFAWWVSKRRPFCIGETGAFDEHGNSILATRRELEEVRRFSLGTLVAHGVIDPFVTAGTYFSFAGVAEGEKKRAFATMHVVAPILHQLFLQTRPTTASQHNLSSLTDRQRELADLAVAGLSDKAIAARLSISDHTVGNHFRAIYAKLGITKRSQLIALLK